MADAKDTKISDLEKALARAEKLSTFTDSHRAHISKLSSGDAEGFISKSAHERDTVLAEIEKANEVVYTSPIDGSVYRKNDDRRLIEMAKRTDDAVAKQRAAEVEARDATFAKRGDETLSNFAKGLKGNLRGRVMKALNAEFSDPAEYEEAIKAMKGMNAAFASLTVAKGFTPPSDLDDNPATPTAKLEQLVTAHAKSANVPYAKAYGAVLETPEGQSLYAQIPVGRA